MKKFLLNILLPVIIAICIFLISFEIYLRQLPNDWKYKREYLDSNANKIQLLVMGPSTISMGIKPSCFDLNGFSIAGPAQAFIFDSWIFDKYIDKMDSLQYVILPFQLITKSGMNQDHSFFLKNYSIYFAYPMQGIEYNYKIGGNLFNTMQRIRNGSEFSIDTDGYQSRYFKDIKLSESQWKELRKKAFNNYQKAKNDTLKDFNEPVYHYNKVINQCSKRNVHCVIVRTPMNMGQYAYTTKGDSLTYCLIDSIMHINKNVKFVDFSVLQLDNDKFFDVQHLNPRGAKKLTLMLNDSIRKWEENGSW